MTEQQRDWSSHDLVWGVKDTFIEYVSSLSDGVISPFGGAEEFPQAGHNEWVFPFTRQEADDSTLRVEFGGELRFRGHHGMLLVILMTPWLTFSGDEATLSVVDVAAWPDMTQRQVIARGHVSWGSDTTGNTDVSVTLSLTEDAVELFNEVYAPGTALAPARLVAR
jgi:hypothetical protein